MYKQLVTETHQDRISSVYCGIDRWFDNHYGYDTTKFVENDPNFMDRIVDNIRNQDRKYRLYYVDHQRDTGQYESDEVLDSNENGEINLFYSYRMIVFDEDGQSIQIIGDFMDEWLEEQPPIYNKQWCATPCPHNEPMGVFNWRKLKDPLYVEDETDIVYQIIYGAENNNTYQISQDNDDNKGDSIIRCIKWRNVSHNYMCYIIILVQLFIVFIIY